MIRGYIRGRQASLLALALLGCPRGETETRAPEPSAEAEPESDRGPDPAAEAVCGTAGQRFADYDWIPDDSRLTTSILRGDPELQAALQVLAEMTTTEDARLPIYAALDYRNLGLQLAALERVLAALELDPGELVELQSPAGDVVWLWPTDCPRAALATRVLDRLGVLLRADFKHPGVRHGGGAREGFPFDLVLVYDEIVALAPLGRGAKVGAWLTAARRDPEGPGAALTSIDPAPIRSVLSGPALLVSGSGSELGSDSGPPDPSSEPKHHRKIRVTATDWRDDAAKAQP